MQAEDIVREARSSQPGLPPAHLLQLVTAQEDPLLGNHHAVLRVSVLGELYKTLSLTDRPLIRFLLEQEMTCRENDYETDIEGIHLCGFLLFLLAQLEDVELLWQAKTTNFDTMCGFDIQFLVGAGVSPTVAYLHSIQQDWAKKARTYIEHCQRSGGFSDLEGYRHFRQRYFFGAEPPEEEANTTEHMET